MGRKAAWVFIVFGALLASCVWAWGEGFTQEDRDRLVRLEATLQVFMEQVDKRFEQVDRRFEQVDRRIQELREDMNKRFEQMMTFMWILAYIFTALTVAVIGFAYWDRRTIIRRAKQETIEEMEERGKLRVLLEVMRQIAVKDSNVAEALRRFNLL